MGLKFHCSGGRIRTDDQVVTRNPVVSNGHGLYHLHRLSPLGVRRFDPSTGPTLLRDSLWTFPYGLGC